METKNLNIQKNNIKKDVNLNNSSNNKTTNNSLEVENKKLKEKIELLESQLKTNNLLNLANIENLKKTHSKNLLEAKNSSIRSILLEILNIKDAFENGLSNYFKSLTKIESKTSYLEGFEMIKRNFSELLNKFNVKNIETKVGDVYNYNLHQPIDVRINNEVAHNSIVKVLQPGYLFNNILLRPTLVIVSKKEEKKI